MLLLLLLLLLQQTLNKNWLRDRHLVNEDDGPPPAALGWQLGIQWCIDREFIMEI